jgi:protein TonB
VLLVNALTEQVPLTPTVIAQDNLEGGGQITQTVIASNPLSRVGNESNDISLIALTRQRQQLELQQDQLLKQALSTWQTRPNQSRSEEKDKPPADGQDQTDQQALEQNARIAAVLDQIERYNQRPRKYFDAPSAIANPFAAYVDAWRRRIEDIGSKHYPPGQGDRPSGQLQASVTIAASGNVLDVTIDKPSSDPRINQAVRRIIELAQPFAAFPAHLARDTDELVITRTWTFTPGSFTTKANP